MSRQSDYRTVKNKFNDSSEEIQKYFEHLKILDDNSLPWDVRLAYVFYRVETAHNDTIYKALVKLHKTDSKLTWKVINSWNMRRDDFINKLEIIINEKMPDNIKKILREAEHIRDKVMHGKYPTDTEKRKAIMDILDYAELFNQFIQEKAGFKPFGGEGRGKLTAEKLSIETSKWILKGMGFPIG
jgi:hypothetical protein